MHAIQVERKMDHRNAGKDQSSVSGILKTARKSLPLIFIPKKDERIGRFNNASVPYPDDGITHLPSLSLGVLSKFKDASTKGLSIGQKVLFWLYKLSQKWFTHIFLTAVLIAYSVTGALIFNYLESTRENLLKRELEVQEVKTLQSLWELRNEPGIPEFIWKRKAKEYLNVYGLHLHKVLSEGGTLEDYNKWDFWSAMFFCGTVITTIGYGNNAPETKAGRMVCMVYALFGIPLLMVCLIDFGKLFTRIIKFIWFLLLKCYYAKSVKEIRKTKGGKLFTTSLKTMYEVATFNKKNYEGTVDSDLDSPMPDFVVDDKFNLPVSMALLILCGYMFVGAVIFPLWEEWSFADAFYFIFISMSTIGFGDILPHHPKFMMATFIYLLFGLSLMSMCINVVTEKFSATMKEASEKIKTTMESMSFNPDGNLWNEPVSDLRLDSIKINDASMPAVDRY